MSLIVLNEWFINEDKSIIYYDTNRVSDFATNNKIVSWFTGGLNFQVEHHLFPNISHIHYPQISKIVKDVCKEYNVTYNEYKNVALAINSHVSHLKQMGIA